MILSHPALSIGPGLEPVKREDSLRLFGTLEHKVDADGCTVMEVKDARCRRYPIKTWLEDDIKRFFCPKRMNLNRSG